MKEEIIMDLKQGKLKDNIFKDFMALYGRALLNDKKKKI